MRRTIWVHNFEDVRSRLQQILLKDGLKDVFQRNLRIIWIRQLVQPMRWKFILAWQEILVSGEKISVTALSRDIKI